MTTRSASRRTLVRAFGPIACALVLAGCSSKAADGPAASRAGGSEVRLSPDPACASARLAVVYAGGERPVVSRIQWRRNGNVIAGAAGEELEPTRFAMGDVVTVEVVASDSVGGPTKKMSAQVRIVNTPPRILRVSLSMTVPAGKPVLQASVEAADPDGETPVLTYRWFRHGAEVAGATGAELPVAGLSRGENVVVEVVAADAKEKSAPVRSDPYEVENRPPQFTSQPNAPRAGETVFRYHAVAVDPDGDELHYRLDGAPVGMTIDSQGNVEWSLPAPEARHGEYPVRIRAVDPNGGEATQDFSVHLDPPATPR